MADQTVKRAAEHNAVMAELQQILNAHRERDLITCEESCWCWSVEEALVKLEMDNDESVPETN